VFDLKWAVEPCSVQLDYTAEKAEKGVAEKQHGGGLVKWIWFLFCFQSSKYV
jgi:hypothetical protein